MFSKSKLVFTQHSLNESFCHLYKTRSNIMASAEIIEMGLECSMFIQEVFCVKDYCVLFFRYLETVYY